MTLELIDWFSIILFIAISLLVGVWVSRRAGQDSGSFFLSGRNMPWWLLGASMVATTFSTDTPNLVTDIVRTQGVAGNWVWWAFLITGIVTCFIYARLWRRSGVMTDLEFYELRYSGKAAGALRAFRAIYLGVFFNVMVMAMVSLAAIKIGSVMLGLTPLQTIAIAGVATVIFSTLGGFLGVVITDMILFIISMVGAVCAAYVAVGLPEVGGLQNLFSHPQVADKLSFLPDFSDTSTALAVFIIPLTVQWWSVWYPGSEPGGGGYVAQRMLAAKNERHAMAAVLLFQLAHYALRPWPWIIVALASLVVFPDLASIKAAFPHVEQSVIGHDLAYPAMLTYLPHGLLGLVLASLISAYMSTMSTQLNWGASYIVNDFYKRFIKPDASEKHLVLVARISTVLLMALACTLALYLRSAIQAFNILLTIGAGTGLLFLLRWFWWRINAFSEISAMVISFAAALYFQFADVGPLTDWQRLIAGVAVTTAGWLLVSLLAPATDKQTLQNFYRLIQPGGAGWRKVVDEAKADGIDLVHKHREQNLAGAILCVFAGCMGIYSVLFAIGSCVYGNYLTALVLAIVAVVSFVVIAINRSKYNREEQAVGDVPV